jgi:hypothetical protein
VLGNNKEKKELGEGVKRRFEGMSFGIGGKVGPREIEGGQSS